MWLMIPTLPAQPLRERIVKVAVPPGLRVVTGAPRVRRSVLLEGVDLHRRLMGQRSLPGVQRASLKRLDDALDLLDRGHHLHALWQKEHHRWVSAGHST